jgi:hypothetical protein
MRRTRALRDRHDEETMVELTEAWRGVLEALASGQLAWQSPAELADRLGREVEETTDLLCDLDVAGWLEVWESETGTLVTLSPLAAERLGVRLIESGPDATPRWSPVGEPEPREPRATHVTAASRAAALDFVLDPEPDPGEAAVGSERAASVAAALRAQAAGTWPRPHGPAGPTSLDDLPSPSLLIGVGLTPWPGPDQLEADAICPACGSRRLGPHMYCLCCDRWGLDGLFGGARSVKERARDRSTTTPDPLFEKLQADRLRDRRKTKRLKHHLLRVEAQRHRRRAATTGSRRPDPPPVPGPGA